jgi:Fe-S-cluster containining protein
VITDLVQIKLLGEKKREENLRFRKHMKSRDHSDRILRRIAQGVEDQIDCLQCANCCRVATAKVNERDVERLSKYLRIKPARFLADFTVKSEEEGVILKRDPKTGCIFLNGNECTVYEARPESCQKFPHVVRGNGSIASRMWEFVDRACYCPIVYNSLEAFKEELKFQK